MMKVYLIPAAILALSFAPAYATEGRARYEVHVDGLACPFCVRGLEKRLLALPGASNLRVDLAAGLARFESKEALLPESLDKAVRDAGFSPRAIRMSNPGTLQGTGDHPSLLIGENKLLPLAGGSGYGRLQALVAAGKRKVALSGEAAQVRGRWKLSVEEVEEVRP